MLHRSPTCRWYFLAAVAAVVTLPVLPYSRGQAPAAPAAKPSVDDQDFSAELPRIPAVEPAEALKTLVLKPGLRIEQVAHEPLVTSPVAIAWDENCNLYVCEMRGYSERRDDKLSRIRVLRDDDGDGRYDRADVLVDGLLWPTALACWDGGLFVGDAPHIYYFKDEDGDGRADRREIVYTGFNTSNVQGLLNSFHWTLDNRIHGSASTIGGDITRPDVPNFPAVSVRGRNFEIDPRTRSFKPTSGGAQHGLSFDDWGTAFVCSNSNHLQQIMFEDRYVARNAYVSAPSARIDIAADGPQAEVYRSSPVEPWRIVRTRLRVSGAVPGAVEGGGRAAGYFTGATGATIYRGDLLPRDFRGMAIVGDVGSNLVHRKRMTVDGLQYLAERIDDKSELLTSTDIWFRPVQFENGPDGALYVIDMYREMIEHPASIPQTIKKHLDTSSGLERGRLYRILPADGKPRALPRLGKASTGELVGLLEHPNAWHRETASRLLYQRQDMSAVKSLQHLAVNSPEPVGRVHALYALDGLQQLTPDVVLRATRDRDEHVRRHAVRLAERFVDRKEPDQKIAERLVAMTDDDSIRVRYQLAFTLGYVPAAMRREAIVDLARRDAPNRWMRLALQSSLADDAAGTLIALMEDKELRKSQEGSSLLTALATQVSRQNRPDDVAAVIAKIETVSANDSVFRGLVEGRGAEVRRRLATDKVLGQELARAAERNELIALDNQATIKRRVAAIQALIWQPEASIDRIVNALLESQQSSEIQAAAIHLINESNTVVAASRLVEKWSTLSPTIKNAALDVLLSKPERALVLLGAIRDQHIPATELDQARVKQLLQHRSSQVASAARELLGNLKFARRQDVVDAYRPVLKMPGDVARGKLVFGKICANCHRAENAGFEIGPNLSAMKNRGAEAILMNVLDPSREVNPQFVNYTCITNDGRSITGLLAAESATSITLRRAENQQDVVLRIDIDELRSTGLSLMPEGLEKQLDQQALADVIAYIMQLP